MRGLTTTATERPRVAFQGERGAFGEEAIARRWGAAAVPVPQPTFADVVGALLSGDAAYGMLPLENTIAGQVHAAVAALATSVNGGAPLDVVGELRLNVRQCLLALPGATLDVIESVESHPIALAQCGDFLRRTPRLRVRAVEDTAGAARTVAAAGDPRRAAIAGRAAAERYGLAVLADDVQDRADNVTRFVVVARTQAGCARW